MQTNQVTKTSFGTEISIKVANMRTEQTFVIYPYDGTDNIYIQSDKRFAKINLRSGLGIINAKNENYANSIHLQIKSIPFEMPNEALVNIKKYLWNNDGKDGGNSVVFYENKKLYENSI